MGLLILNGSVSLPKLGDASVHLRVPARTPNPGRCTAAIVTRVADGRVFLSEFAAYSGHRAVYGGAGFAHISEAPATVSSWHYRAECPDGL